MKTVNLNERELLEIDGGVVGDGEGGTCTDNPITKKIRDIFK